MNLGDDIVIRILSERYPFAKFIFFARKKYRKAFKYKNIKIASSVIEIRNKVEKILERSKKKSRKSLTALCDLIVYIIDKKIIDKKYPAKIKIVGSVFSEPVDWDPKLKNVNFYSFNSPMYVLGANFGPYRSEKFKEAYREAFEKCEWVSFRDKYSYDLFSDLKNVRYAPDIVFSGNFKAYEQKDVVAVSVINCDFEDRRQSEYTEKYEKMIAEIASYFASMGKKVIVMSFCEYEGDEKTVKRVCGMIDEKYADLVVPYYYRGDIDEAVRIISESSFVVATRLHAMILGLYFGKKIYPVVYNEKVIHTIEDIGYKGRYLSFSDLDGFDIGDVKYNYDNEFKIDLETIKRESENHFKALDELFGK